MDKLLSQFLDHARAQFGVDIEAKTIDEARERLKGMRSRLDGPIVRAALAPPMTIDEAKRTVDCVIATETPVFRFNWKTYDFENEILLMDGCRIDELKDGIPLLDSHDAYAGLDGVLGTTTGIRRENDKLVGTRVFSTVQDKAKRAFDMIREGHLKKQSLGYRVLKSVVIPPGETAVVFNAERKNDAENAIRYVTDWLPIEDSIVIVPADPTAGIRSGVDNLSHIDSEPNPTQKRNDPMKDNETPKTEPAVTTATKTEPPAIDEKAIRRQAQEDERQRVLEIRTMCERHGIPAEKEAAFIKGEGYESIDKVRKAILDHMAEQTRSEPAPPAGRVTVEKDSMDKLIPVMRDGMMLTQGVIGEKEAEAGASEFRGLRPQALIGEFLQRRGEIVKFSITPSELFKRAMATTDFPNLLSNTAERTAMKSFEKAPETYPLFCDLTGNVKDLRPKTVARITGQIDLLEVKEGQESDYAYFSEDTDTVQIVKLARKAAWTEEATINDDLGAFMDVLVEFGEAAARAEGDMAYAFLIDNPDMKDGTDLFHSDHRNLAATAAVPSETSVQAAITAMATQLDNDGTTRIRITPTYIIGPVHHQMTIGKLLASAQFNDSNAGATQVNTVYNRLQQVYDARIDAAFAAAVAASTGKWPWFVAGPKGRGIKFYYLNGQRRFQLDRWEDKDRDALVVKIKHRVGCHVESWQGLYKNAGA